MRPRGRLPSERPTDPIAPDRDELQASSVEAAACELLRRHGVEVPGASRDALATAVMDLFRRTGSRDVFEVLVRLCRDALRRRVRARVRFLGDRVDADELLQDAIINIYRYPDRFDACRPGAFKAWSSTIVDNAVRRHLRRTLAGPDVKLQPVELLAEEPDRVHRGPGAQAMESEAFEQVAAAYRLFLCFYLAAYQGLSERERFVLQMVETKGVRYAELALILRLRPEALKMVVFRARKRVLERVSAMLAAVSAEPETARPAASEARRAPCRRPRAVGAACAG